MIGRGRWSGAALALGATLPMLALAVIPATGVVLPRALEWPSVWSSCFATFNLTFARRFATMTHKHKQREQNSAVPVLSSSSSDAFVTGSDVQVLTSFACARGFSRSSFASRIGFQVTFP